MGQIRSHHRDEGWSGSLWQTFFGMSMGTLDPSHWWKTDTGLWFQKVPARHSRVSPLGDHLCTCTVHSGVKKVHDWVVDQLADIFVRHIKWKHNGWLKAGVIIVGTSNYRDTLLMRWSRYRWWWISVIYRSSLFLALALSIHKMNNNLFSWSEEPWTTPVQKMQN